MRPATKDPRGVVSTCCSRAPWTPSRPRCGDAVLEADALSVETFPGGLVILSGTVRSRAAHDHAMAATWAAPGVTQVENRVRVENA